MSHHKYDKQAQEGLVMFHSDDIDSKMDRLDTQTAIAAAVCTVCVLVGMALGFMMYKGNCGKCKKAEFETTDVHVESLGQRSGMIVDDGWISVEEESPRVLQSVLVSITNNCTDGSVGEAMYQLDGNFVLIGEIANRMMRPCVGVTTGDHFHHHQ